MSSPSSDGLSTVDHWTAKYRAEPSSSSSSSLSSSLLISARPSSDADAEPPSVLIGVVILGWMMMSITILVTNKYIIPQFTFPMSLTAMQMLTCTLLSNTAVRIPALCPPAISVKSVSHGLRIAGLAIAFTLSIVAGQAALAFISLGYDQMIGSTTPIWVAILSLVMTGKAESLRTYCTLGPIVIGVMMGTKGEASFVFTGFVLLMMSTISRAFKTVLQKILLSDPNEKMDSLNLLRFMAPISLVILLPSSLIFESRAFPDFLARIYDSSFESGAFVMVVGVNLLTAFFVNYFNVMLTHYTSALTVQVVGTAKGILATLFSFYLFEAPVTPLGLLGYAIALIGVWMYSASTRLDSEQMLAADYAATAALNQVKGEASSQKSDMSAQDKDESEIP